MVRPCGFGLVKLVDFQGAAGLSTTSVYTRVERYQVLEFFASSGNTYPITTFTCVIWPLRCVMLEVCATYPISLTPDACIDSRKRAAGSKPQIQVRGS